MEKQLFTKVDPTDFENPLIYVVTYSHENGIKESSTVRRNLFKNIQGTWGYSQVHYSVSSDFRSIPRVYYMFEDQLDVLQFSLLVNHAVRAYMWPQNTTFTVHRLSESQE